MEGQPGAQRRNQYRHEWAQSSSMINTTYASLGLTRPQVTILTLELDSPSLPPGKKIVLELANKDAMADLKKHPIIIKEGVEYK